MKTFLDECIARILKENKDLSKITIILPTQRLCSIFISLLIKEINCLGRLSLLSGHNLDPEPPHKIITRIETYFTSQ